MKNQNTPDTVTLQHASVGTRWHQLSAILGLLLIGPLLGWLVLPLVDQGHLSFWQCLLVTGLGMALPGVLVTILLPTRQSVSVDAEGLYLARYGRVPFSGLDELRRRDFLTLQRRGRMALIIQQGKHDPDAFHGFCDAAWKHWLNWLRENPRPAGAKRRTVRYDNIRIAGMTTVAATLLVGLLALIFNVTMPATVLLVLAGLTIVGLVCAIFYGA